MQTFLEKKQQINSKISLKSLQNANEYFRIFFTFFRESFHSLGTLNKAKKWRIKNSKKSPKMCIEPRSISSSLN